MTPWAQAEVQRMFNTSSVWCDLFGAAGVGHSSLFPGGNVTSKNSVPVGGVPVPVMNHSYTWITTAMNLAVKQ